MADRAVKTALFDAFARAAKALASGRRLELLDVLANGERTVEALAGEGTLAAGRLAEVERLAADYLGARDQLEPVTREELARRLQDRDDVFVLDVRPAAEHAAGHLPGAVSIPVDELRRRLAELPRDREIVAYCRGPYCAFAHEAVVLLREAGLSARRLEDGLPEWQAGGLAVS